MGCPSKFPQSYFCGASHLSRGNEDFAWTCRIDSHQILTVSLNWAIRRWSHECFLQQLEFWSLELHNRGPLSAEVTLLSLQLIIARHQLRWDSSHRYSDTRMLLLALIFNLSWPAAFVDAFYNYLLDQIFQIFCSNGEGWSCTWASLTRWPQ